MATTHSAAGANGTARQAAPARSVFDMAAVPPKPKRRSTPLPDPDAVVVRHDAPIPPARRGDLGRGVSVYAAIWARLKVGSCAELPEPQAKSLMSYCKRNNFAFVVRKLDDGRRGVWRTA